MTSQALGTCSHRHLTLAATALCAYLHQRDLDKVGRYDDRRLVAFDGNLRREATSEENREFDGHLSNIRLQRQK
jgi:hypothetical protein